MTDDKLKQALAKMLPDVVIFGAFRGDDDLHWKSEQTEDTPVLDTELLHFCALVESKLTIAESCVYFDLLREIEPDNDAAGSFAYHATWQQRATALAKVKGIEV